MQDIEVGQIVEGKVTGITNFGAFVDLGDGKSGMVHISEVAVSFVNNIRDFLTEGDTVRAKVISVGENGKIALSIKKAVAPEPRKQQFKPKNDRQNRRPRTVSSDNGNFTGYGFGADKSGSDSFEEMMNRFKQNSEDKFSDLKRKNSEMRRTKRGAFK